MARNDKRREPTFENGRRGELRADPRERPGRRSARDDYDDGDDEPPRARRAKPAKKRRRSFLGFLVYWTLTLGLWGAIAGAGLLLYYGSRLPPIDQLAVPKRPPNISILASDGELLANRGDTGGAAVPLGELPPYLPKAFVAIEDHRFYSHWGIDPMGIVRALLRNVAGRGGMQGGSTLTQQLAKNLFLTQERTISRKIQEAILALWLEHKYSKDQILELYLNRVYFGSGAYGVEAAAQRYYGHGARAVSLAEAAVLAGLMKAPSKLAPDRNPVGAKERAAQVIDAMAREGFITQPMAKLALDHSAKAHREQGAGSINYAADFVMDQLDEAVGAVDQDLVVTTTLNHALQLAAERALTEELDKKGEKFGVSQGAVVALDPNGAIRALVGGRDYSDSQFNRAVSAKRQPGSAFKPFVYLAGVEHGLEPDTVREDGPLNIKGWQPENYSHEYFGPVTLTKALSLSLNTVAVRVGMEVGPKTVAKTAKRLGVNSELQPNPSLALGTSEVTPLELVSAYAPFANGGLSAPPFLIVKVKSGDGKLLFSRKTPANRRVIDSGNVAMMNEMMQETLLTGTARKAELPGWQAAGKTGTSQDFRDAWFVGYTSHLVTGVWLGNDDGSPTKKASGGNLPVEIWSRFMKTAHQNVPIADLPGGDREERDVDEASPASNPLDDLIGLFTGEERRAPAPPPAPARQRPARPPVRLPAAPAPSPDVAAPMDLTPHAPVPSPPAAPPRGARPAPAPAPAPAPRAIEDLLPPEDIPTVGAPRSERRPARPSGREKNLLDRLFGQ